MHQFDSENGAMQREAEDDLLLELGSARIPLRQNGHLEDVLDWNRDVARALAARDGLGLGDAHWLVINAMRDYYLEFNVVPTVKLLKRCLRERPVGWQIDDAVLAQLFPAGVMEQGTRIAGVPVHESQGGSPVLSAATTAPGSANSEFELDGKRYAVYVTGNLVHPEDWNERVAEFLAARENVCLTEDHWEVIYFLRGFYFEFGISPMVKILIKHLQHELGAARANRDYLYTLFPGGPARQGSRLAGLPEPPGCID